MHIPFSMQTSTQRSFSWQWCQETSLPPPSLFTVWFWHFWIISTGDPPPVAKSILLIFLHTSIDTMLCILSILHFLCTTMCIVWQLGAEQVDCTSCIISLRVPRLSILYAYEAGNKCMIISLCIFYPFRILHLRPVCRVHCSATSATREQVDCTLDCIVRALYLDYMYIVRGL